jgi:hypothetical protein
MAAIRLAKIPDRTPVKLTISVSPDLKGALDDYALIYAQTYGRDETIVELVPAMLEAFLATDRAFSKARASIQAGRP